MRTSYWIEADIPPMVQPLLQRDGCIHPKPPFKRFGPVNSHTEAAALLTAIAGRDNVLEAKIVAEDGPCETMPKGTLKLYWDFQGIQALKNDGRKLAFTPQQQLFVNSIGARKWFQGTVASGKTYVGAVDLILRAEANKRYLALAPTYRMGEDSGVRAFLTLAKSLGVLSAYSKSYRTASLTNGATIDFGSADAQRQSNFHWHYDGLWCDEAAMMQQEEYEAVRLHNNAWVTFTCSKPERKHADVPHWVETITSDWYIVKANTFDNPFIPREFAEQLQAQFKQ